MHVEIQVLWAHKALQKAFAFLAGLARLLTKKQTWIFLSSVSQCSWCPLSQFSYRAIAARYAFSVMFRSFREKGESLFTGEAERLDAVLGFRKSVIPQAFNNGVCGVALGKYVSAQGFLLRCFWEKCEKNHFPYPAPDLACQSPVHLEDESSSRGSWPHCIPLSQRSIHEFSLAISFLRDR